VENSALSATIKATKATKMVPRVVKETSSSNEFSFKRGATSVKKEAGLAEKTIRPAQYADLEGFGRATKSEQRVSLERMRTDPVATIKKRVRAIDDARNKIFNVYRADKSHLKSAKSDVQEALKPSLDALTSHRDAAEANIGKLKMFGEGFDIPRIQEIDAEVGSSFGCRDNMYSQVVGSCCTFILERCRQWSL
jgi:hypothetical protein